MSQNPILQYPEFLPLEEISIYFPDLSLDQEDFRYLEEARLVILKTEHNRKLIHFGSLMELFNLHIFGLAPD